MNKCRTKIILIFFIFLQLFPYSNKMLAQNDVMMQAFYWDVPVDIVNKNGTWWDTLRIKAPSLSSAGFTGMWIPPPSKGNWGITDMGYGIFDHYDLGNYNQKGSIETRFGSRSELNSMINTMRNNNIKVYADVILNHIYAGETEREVNPAVKSYVFNEAVINGIQRTPYPTNEITWKIPNAQPGDYYIQIVGYHLNWSASHTERGYDLYIDWTGVGPNGTDTWESEPNNGNGQFNVFPGPGRTVRGHAQSISDIDEFKITVTTARDIIIKLIAKREVFNPWAWVWASQTNGFYPKRIWYNSSNLAPTSLQATTMTGIKYVNHTGTGEPNYSWTYTDFHPADNNDFLTDGGANDEVIPRTKWFGNDLNTFSTTVQNRLKNWGIWLSNTIGFDGYRLDFVRGFPQSFAADWIRSLPLLNGTHRYIVAEYWGNAQAIHSWVNTIASYGADADAFDFPLKFTLTDMTNRNQNDFNMAWLNHAGMVRNNTGHALSGLSISTFVENHDTGKESDKWVTKDWKMAYSYILTHEGRPTIFYPHYYSIRQIDYRNSNITVQAPSSLQTDIRNLIGVRKNYLGGITSVLSQVGNPVPSGDTYHVYAARRQGNGTRDGAIIVINNHDTQTKGLWVDSSPVGFSNWANVILCNAFNFNETTQVYADGRVYVSAPPRGYKVWVKRSEYIVLPKENSTPQLKNQIPTEFNLEQNYPNPFNPSTVIRYKLSTFSFVTLKVYDALGREVATLVNEYQQPGTHNSQFAIRSASDRSQLPSGVYFYRLQAGDFVQTKKMLFLK
ncbi:MAG: alpha-amylase family glycosyl hydrolase [Bacteroidota bacterium]